MDLGIQQYLIGLIKCTCSLIQ